MTDILRVATHVWLELRIAMLGHGFLLMKMDEGW